MRVDLCILAYGNPKRLRQLLRCHGNFDLQPVRIVESPSMPAVARDMQELALHYGCPYLSCPQPGEMQDTAQHACATSPGDWIIFWCDDVLPTPTAFSSLSTWLRDLPPHVGAVQAPYWNFDDYKLQPTAPKTHDIILDCPSFDWLLTVPRNPHWETVGPAYYLNCNGAGFAVRLCAWRDVGGFSPETWCFDEDIAVRLWLSGHWTVVSVPGPPLVHQCAGSAPDRQTFGITKQRSHTVEGWLDAWKGRSKEELDLACREQMALWAAKTLIPAR